MDILSRIILILVSFFQAFSLIFPSSWLPDYDVPEDTTGGIIEEDTTGKDEPSTDVPEIEEPTECTHTGGTATCIKKAVCTLCNQEYGELAGHAYSSKTIAPTCTVPGRTYYTCTVCGHSYNDKEVAPEGHSYQATETAPTCLTGGYITYKCSGCNDEYVINTSVAGGHNITTTTIAATCEEGGYKLNTCTVCDYSYETERTEALGHSYSYYSNNDATCTADGTKTAVCDNGCGSTWVEADIGSMLPHVDVNEDAYCDNGGERLYAEFTALTYPAEAVKTADDWRLSVDTIISRADADNDAVYVANQGYEDINGVIVSPYYTAKVDGTAVPVYAATVYVGETEKGALHSYSEIYIGKGEYATFVLELEAKGLTMRNAQLLPEIPGKTVNVANNKATVTLSGLGIYTITINDGAQEYAYTLFVREEIDDDAEIEKLEAQGYTVYPVEGYLENFTYTVFHGEGTANSVIYLKKGAYVTAAHIYDITSDELNSSIVEQIEDKTALSFNDMGLNRMPFVSAHATSNVKVVGYGTLDLTHLDRGERRGVVFTKVDTVEVRGIKLINAPEWSFITYKCKNVTVKDVDIFGYRLNSDAFDICNSQNVTVSGCFARSGDDLFGVKALNDDASVKIENIVFSDCYAWAGKARAFGIFGECNRSISDVYFRDSYVLCHDAAWDPDRIPAIGIVVETANPESGAITLDNINFENITICRNDSSAINCLIFNGVNNFSITNLNFRNVTYSSNRVLNRVVNNGGYSSNNVIQASFEGLKCNGTAVVDSNKTQYFSAKAYEGGYITIK